ncbi:hypothetical protein [Herbaspirillum sp. YR522]|uniref:hypothetical protein n=1 Tax=Herbaspirillum sp. YR522 TaxID=1144342 RepID=UPI00026FB35B|nr:hypothetical protein [Herbaspirillum sp. YR522]EJN07808.1 hypothetical protein PMI40_01704 [Herbaspirillum sp. YR522]
MRFDAALAREGKERSRALESKYYGWGGDPANHVEFESELRRREAVRKAKRQERKGIR